MADEADDSDAREPPAPDERESDGSAAEDAPVESEDTGPDTRDETDPDAGTDEPDEPVEASDSGDSDTEDDAPAQEGSDGSQSKSSGPVNSDETEADPADEGPDDGEIEGGSGAPTPSDHTAADPGGPLEKRDQPDDDGDLPENVVGGNPDEIEGVPTEPTDNFGGLSGPASDQEMPLSDHIEEMVKRLGVVILVAAVASAIVLPLGDSIITFLWDSILAGTDTRPHLYSPPELIITQVKVASLAGLIVALPVLVYQSYLFMRPGLYPNERRYYLAAVPTSLVLAFVGLVFAYFIVLPAVFTYFLEYSEETAVIAFGLAPTFNLILILLGYLAVVFQIPLFVMLAMVMGLVTREWLIARRLLFWGAFAGISFLFSPDPTGISPLIIAVTMIVLFEGTLFLARWTKAGRRTAGG